MDTGDPFPTRNSPSPSSPLKCISLYQALIAPQHPALFFEDTVTTYGELHSDCRVVSRKLVSLGSLGPNPKTNPNHGLFTRGIRPNTSVALLLNRGPGMLVAIYGVLCAGGCYVPIDTEYPEATTPNRILTLP